MSQAESVVTLQRLPVYIRDDIDRQQCRRASITLRKEDIMNIWGYVTLVVGAIVIGLLA